MSDMTNAIVGQLMNVTLETIQTVDVAVYRFFNAYAGSWLLDHIAGFEEDNNLIKGGLFMAAYTSLWFCKTADQERRRRKIIAIFVGVIISLAVCRTIADIAPFRIRPMFDPSIPRTPAAFAVAPNMESWSSFPSDTAAYFLGLAIGLAHLWRRYASAFIF